MILPISVMNPGVEVRGTGKQMCVFLLWRQNSCCLLYVVMVKPWFALRRHSSLICSSLCNVTENWIINEPVVKPLNIHDYNEWTFNAFGYSQSCANVHLHGAITCPLWPLEMTNHSVSRINWLPLYSNHLLILASDQLFQQNLPILTCS